MFCFSGRTSRREIRKLLWEGLFWRFKRAKVNRQGSRINTHSFLFDDDEETERSIPTINPTPYSALSNQSQTRPNYFSQQSSNNTSPFPISQRSSFFNCCGFTIDLSHKHSEYSSNGDATSRRSTVCKSITNTSPRKFRTYSHSPKSLPSFDKNLHLQQQPASYKLSNDNRHSDDKSKTCRQQLYIVYQIYLHQQ